MRHHSRSQKPALLAVTLLLIFSSACTSQGISPGSSSGGHAPSYLGFVDDPAGEPVAFAILGETETTTWDGVASGDFNGYEGGWLPVEAPGYATGFAYLFPAGDDFPFFSTTLTPFQSFVQLGSGESTELLGYRGEEFRATAEVSGEMFSQTPALVGLTAIDPLLVKPRNTDTELEKGLRLQQAIALQAFDETWAALKLTPGAAVTVHLEISQPPSDSVAFAVFDPEGGVWRRLGPACTNQEPTLYTCELSALTPLLGVFDFPAEPAASIDNGLQQGGSSLGSVLASAPQFQGGVGGEGSSSLGGIIAQIEDWLKQQQDESGGADPNDPTLKNLIDQLIKAALDNAAKNRNESGKKALVQALSVIMAVGEPGAGAALEAEMAKISDEIGKEALKESDCGEFERLLKAAQQIGKLGGSEQLENQLKDKASEMAEDCDVWSGWITVSLWVTSSHPAGLPMKGGGGSWMESHSVQIWTNVDDNVMHGEDKVTYTFATANYEDDKECKSEIKMSGDPGQTTIYFEGFYDGYTFQVNSVTPQGGATIKQHWTMRSKEDDNCEVVLNKDFSFSPYYSLIVHGVSSDSPPINIQEILDSSSVTSTMGKQDSLSGTERITNPDPDLGIYPFRNGFVTWNLMHRQKKLPREEN